MIFGLYFFSTINRLSLFHFFLLMIQSPHLTHTLTQTQNHRAALELLVHELQDPISAEAYCTLGGEVVSERTLRSAAESAGLVGVAMFAAAFSSASPIHREVSGQGGKVQSQTGLGKGQAPTVITRQRTVDEGLKKELLRVLLEVYMDGDE